MAFKASGLRPLTIAAYRAAARAGHHLDPARAERRIALARWRVWAGERNGAPPIWIHAASVGEGLTALPVSRRLTAALPATPIVLTYTSASAHRWPAGWPVDHADYLPPDQPAPVRDMLAALRPRLLIFARADVWPELARAAAARGTPLALIGGTVRAGSGRLRWPVRPLFRSLYQTLAYAGAASGADAARLERLGVQPAVLEVTGDPRHDHVLERVPQWASLRPLTGWVAPGEVLVAGSTEPADEALLLRALATLRQQRPTARLLLCPHHPTPRRTRDLLAQARRNGVDAVAWGGEPFHSDARCVIVERVGVLADLYALGALAYVGGGFGPQGLHAVVEPAAYAVPIIVGPVGHTMDVASLLDAGGAVALPHERAAPELARTWGSWLDDVAGRIRAGLAARRALGGGAARKTTQRLLELLTDDAALERHAAQNHGATGEDGDEQVGEPAADADAQVRD